MKTAIETLKQQFTLTTALILTLCLLDGCSDEMYNRTLCANDIELSNVNNIEVMQREVSNQQYNCCVREGGCPKIHVSDLVISSNEEIEPYSNSINTDNDFSVEGVTWDEANTFCTWIGMRLPSQDEWEHIVTQGGGVVYSWGEETPITCGEDIACSGNIKPPPCSFEIDINQDDICDLTSGLSEWTSTATFDNINQDPPVYFNVKGGSYLTSSLDQFRVESSNSLQRTDRWKGVGFRCVR